MLGRTAFPPCTNPQRLTENYSITLRSYTDPDPDPDHPTDPPMADTKDTKNAKNPLHIPSPFMADSPEMTLEQKEQVYVHSVYQAIAPHFSATRYKVGEQQCNVHPKYSKWRPILLLPSPPLPSPTYRAKQIEVSGSYVNQ